MKRLFITLLVMVALWIFHVPSSQAAMQYIIKRSRPLTVSGIFVDADDNAMDYGVWVYGISLYANVANSQLNLKDCDTITELISASVYPIDEIGEPTQFETTEHSFLELYGRALYFEDGVGGSITTGGVGILTYGVKP